jgi:integrase
MITQTLNSLANVVTAIEQCTDLPKQKRRIWISAIRRLAELRGTVPETIPATVESVREAILDTRVPLHVMSPRSWSNLKSSVKAALKHVGIAPARRRTYQNLPSAWQHLRSQLDRLKYMRVRGLFHYCSDQEIEPEMVDQTVFEDYREHVRSGLLNKDPEKTYVMAVSAWNKHACEISEWPSTIIERVSRSRSFALPIEDFPESFQAEAAEERERLSHADLFNVSGPAKPLRPASLDASENQIRRFSSAMVLAGRPIGELTDLIRLLDVKWFKRTVIWYLEERYGWKPDLPVPINVAETATSIRRHGRYWLERDLNRRNVNDLEAAKRAIDEQLEELSAIVSKLNSKCDRSMKLTEKNRECMRQFDDPQTELALLTLPEALIKGARADGKPTHRKALLVQTAIIFGILLASPIRFTNLRNLRFDRHLKSIRGSKGNRSSLFIPASETKNTIDIEVPLSQQLCLWIKLYRELYLPHLASADCPWFFPGRDSSWPKSRVGFRHQFDMAVKRYVGVKITPHQFRHLAAKQILEAFPGNYALAQQLLHHKNIQTTVQYYAGFDHENAARQFQDILEDRTNNLSRPKSRRRVG